MSGLIRAVVDAANDHTRWVRRPGVPLLTPLFVSLAVALGTPRLADAHAIRREGVRVESPASEHRELRTAIDVSGFQQRLASLLAHELRQRTVDIGGHLPPPRLTEARAGPTLDVTVSPTFPHVRDNGDPAIAVLLRVAQERSATFRRLVETIDATDGIVYVEQGRRCGAGVRACLLLSVTVAGPSRILRVYVIGDRDPAEVMASIGHELQHAVEVLRERGVTTGVLMFQFFDRRVGSLSARHKLSFETEAALNAGDAVRAEIERSRRSLSSHPGVPLR
jgi:hypothetical protein